MSQSVHRRRATLVAAAVLFAMVAGVGAIEFVFPLNGINLESEQILRLTPVKGFNDTGFSVQSPDGTALTLNGEARYNTEPALQSGQDVQEGFILLDGTLSLDLDARKLDGTRARTINTFRFNIRARSLTRDFLARTLVRRGLVRDLTRARTRARHIDLDDTRVMRLVERNGKDFWTRAIRTTRDTRSRTFRSRSLPDGIVGHFGNWRPANGDPYVWAVMDHNSRYAVGVTVDRDGDGIPNSADNCVGSANPNQGDADGDGAGNDCDLDDDNDAVADAADNCPLNANADQNDTDGDGVGNACEDGDNDGVLDAADRCLGTAIGSIVAPNGCSIADSCPCETSWRNHGAYVKCVAQTSNSFFAAGLITGTRRDGIVSAAAQSACGF